MSSAAGVRAPAVLGEPVLFLAAFSWAAAAIHAVVAVPHFEESFLLGAIFLVVAAAQGGWAVLVYQRAGRGWLIGGLALNAGVLFGWVVSRTAGLPVGPDADRPEAVGFPDLAASVDEFALMLLAGGLLRATATPRTLGIWTRQAALVVLIFAGVGLMAAGHTHS